jgi:copper homeostasis protein
MKLEICIDSVESAIAAEQGGAQRAELCSDLLEGGITPSAGLIASVRRQIGIGLWVMIRPRGGDFCYTDREFEVMQEEIGHARTLGADGLVLGILDQQACVDVPRTRRLVELADPLPVTFHRAIDMTPDLSAALQDVIATGASRVLTSGGAKDAVSGISQIARMVEIAGEQIVIMPGGGISPENIAAVAEGTRATEFHASLRTAAPSPVHFRKQGIAMGSIEDREFQRFTVHEQDVRALSRAIERRAEQQASTWLG